MVEKIKRIKEEVVGVAAVMGSLYFFLILFTHHLRDPVLFFRSTEPLEPLRNLGGIVGAYVSGWLLILFGISAYAIPVFIMAFGIKRLLGKEGHKIYLLGSLLFLLSFSILSALLSNTFTIAIEKYPDGIGGLTGRGIASFTGSLVSSPRFLYLCAFAVPVFDHTDKPGIGYGDRIKEKKERDPAQRNTMKRLRRLFRKNRRFSSENPSLCRYLHRFPDMKS